MNLTGLYKLTYGVYVVTSVKKGKLNGQIANTVFQITSEPPQVAVSINKGNLTHEFIRESGVFAVSILSRNAPLKLIGNFGFKSGRDVDKFENVKYTLGTTGAPLLMEHTIAHLEVEVMEVLDAGTHTLFTGRVVNTEVLSNDEPMTYAYYHEIKKGKAPKTAPTYRKEEKTDIPKKETGMKKYECKVCGYVYDPEIGDPDSGIAQGTPFEELPADWVCPVCGASKDEFEEV